jgi:6-phospho-3-hexuloisomerase
MTNTEKPGVADRLSQVVDELVAIVHALDGPSLEALVQAVVGAKRVFFSGQGRSGLMLRAFAIRLLHVGISVHVAGEPSAPSIAQGDLLLAASASAKTATTLTHIETAQRVGAKVALISAVERASVASDVFLQIPARTAVPSVQHAGSLFEQALLLVGDAVAWRVQQQLGVDDRLLNERHANLQ